MMTLFEQKIQQHSLIPVISLPSVESGLRLSEILMKCGMGIAEITFRTEYAEEGIMEIKKRFPEMCILAGTVLTPSQVDRALGAGAEAIVSPGTEAQVVEYCLKMDVPVFPGVCSPSEIQLALSLGISKLKFFPAELSGGIPMIKTLLSVYKNISLMPTGGISPENILEYLRIDRVLCCGGTWLAPEAMLADGLWDDIENRIVQALELI